jgi:hypothetical protein
MRAVLAARDVAAERCRAAVLDRTHHLEPAEAHMAGIGLTPCRSMVAENIRHLQLRTRHARRASGGRLNLRRDLHGWRHGLGHGLGLIFFGDQRREAIERAHHLADGVGGDPRIERRRFKLGMAEQSCVIMHLRLTH